MTALVNGGIPFARSPIAAAAAAGGAGDAGQDLLHGVGPDGKPLTEEAAKRRLRELAEKTWQASGEMLAKLVQMLLNFLRAIMKFFQPAQPQAQADAKSPGKALAGNGRRDPSNSVADAADGDGANGEGVPASAAALAATGDGSSAASQAATLTGKGFGALMAKAPAAASETGASDTPLDRFAMALHAQYPSPEDLLSNGDPVGLVRAFVQSQASVLQERKAEARTVSNYLDEDIGELANRLELEPEEALQKVLDDPSMSDSLSVKVRTQHASLREHEEAVDVHTGLIVHSLVAAKAAGLEIDHLEVADLLKPVVPDWRERVESASQAAEALTRQTLETAANDSEPAAPAVPVSVRAGFAISSDPIEISPEPTDRPFSRLREAVEQHPDRTSDDSQANRPNT